MTRIESDYSYSSTGEKQGQKMFTLQRDLAKLVDISLRLEFDPLPNAHIAHRANL